MPQEFNNAGAFLPTSDVYDTQTIQELEVNSQEFKNFLVRLRQSVNNVALMVNIKDSGFYNTTEFVNGQVWFPNTALSSTTPQVSEFRQVFRMVVDFGALPNTAAKSVNHNIDITSATVAGVNPITFTRIYATASDTTGLNYIPIPYASPVLANNIELSVNATQVTITTGSDRTNFNQCYVVLEYIRS